jgi:hypothetical protein
MGRMTVLSEVCKALDTVPESDRTAPAREVAKLLAEGLDGDTSPNERAALARELRQTLATVVPQSVGPDGWSALLDDIQAAA